MNFDLPHRTGSRSVGGLSNGRTLARVSGYWAALVGVWPLAYNGRQHVPVLVNENMVGHKLGEFALTRTYKGHVADKKSR